MKKIILFMFAIILSINFAAAKQPLKVGEGGYKGTLPDISSYFEYKKETSKYAPRNDIKMGAPSESSLMGAPDNDTLFVDMILKKGKPTQYVNDMLSILTLFEKFRASLTKEINIQQYNAQVNMIDLYVKKLMQNYNETSHAMSESYIWCQQINYRAKLLGNLMYDSNYYSKYMPVSNTPYSTASIGAQKANLMKELDKAIFVLKRLDE